MKIRLKNELPLVFIYSLILVLIIAFTDLKLIRLVLGLPFVLLLPGYLLTAAIFPGRFDLEGLHRLGLSFGLSIIIVPLIGFALNYMPWGISLFPILVSLILFIMTMSSLTWYRRKRLSDKSSFTLSFNVNFQWSEHSKARKVMQVVFIGALLLMLVTFSHVLASHKFVEKFTEFYILGQKGIAADYPQELEVGEYGELLAGIINNEHQKINYQIEVRMDSQLINRLSPITLEHREKWENLITFQADKPGKNVKVELMLFREDISNQIPYRKLQLWVTIRQREPQLPPNIIYVVRKGDSLSLIAKKYGKKLNTVIVMNPQIKNPNLIYPGQEIFLPN